MRFFFDRCLSKRLAHMLAIYEKGSHHIVHLDDDPRFEITTPDVTWMSVLDADNEPPWVVITKDERIAKNKVEREMLRNVSMKFFFLKRQWDQTVQ